MIENKNIIHYGCSFTFGQDSGGDGNDDVLLSYPAHLSKLLLDTTFDIKAEKGDSNDTAFLKLYADIFNKKTTYNDVVFFNITSIYRSVYLNDELTGKIIINDLDWGYQNVLPSYDFNFDKSKISTQMYENYRNSYFYQSELAFNINIMKNIYSVNTICKEYNIDVYFVDLFGDLRYFVHDRYTEYKKIKIFTAPNKRSLVHYIRHNKQYHNMISKSEHFYSDGYKMIAEIVYNNLIKEQQC